MLLWLFVVLVMIKTHIQSVFPWNDHKVRKLLCSSKIQFLFDQAINFNTNALFKIFLDSMICFNDMSQIRVI